MILNPQIQLKAPDIQSKIDIASLQAGDIVWACNFRRNIGGFRYKTKPTKGMIVDNPKCRLVKSDDNYTQLLQQNCLPNQNKSQSTFTTPSLNTNSVCSVS